MSTPKSSTPKFPSPARLAELRATVRDGYVLGPQDQEDLDTVLVCALMVHAGRESDAMDAAQRRSIVLPRTAVCQHPGNCERQEDGYCGRCHSELYP